MRRFRGSYKKTVAEPRIVSLPEVPPPEIDVLKSYALELQKIESELTRRHRENGIEYYVPNPIQYQAHKSPCQEIQYMGGNRSGKTTYAMVEVVIHSTGKYPDWYSVTRRFNRPVKIKIISPKFKEGIGDVIEPKLRSLMPSNAFIGRPKRSPQGYWHHADIKWRDGQGVSTIDFLSQEQDLMSFEGTDADIVVADEPLKRSIYIALQRGLIDRDGWFICAFTALKEAWMKELTDQADGIKRAVFVADMRDNKWDIRGNSILKEESIKRFEDNLSEDEKEIRIHGRYYHLSGLVYKELDSTVHIVDKLPDKYVVWASLDPHDRNPHWMIWAAVDPTNDVVIFKELISQCPLYELSKQIKSIEKDFNMHTRLIDPNFGHKPSAVGANLSVQDQLRKFGVDFIDGMDDIEAGVACVREALRYNKNKVADLTNKPKLFFLRNAVPQTLKAMFNLQYRDWKGIADEKEDNERIMEKNSHASDTIRYLLSARPRYQKYRIYGGIDEKMY